MFSNLIQLFSVALIFVAVLAIITSVIIQLTKDTKLFDKMPTELEVIVVSIILAVVAFVGFCDWKNITVLWYYVVSVIILGIISAFVCMHGWEKLITIVYKFRVPKELRDIYENFEDDDNYDKADDSEEVEYHKEE